ncbi:hypothetical protein RB979_003738 [Vibrio alginolyticus]|uniref:hypothetical protein n=1 Tax=Vibrio alginolyticus TaxID=663 RepID=UPI001BD48E85|nr:hypothetical protein [Vibrio alginolyticus]ELA6781484.1 hypothetical protein [Vibrio alginolyticus]MBS9931019.1 hypothetical protein [Vibrio alginolyticus]
MQWDDVNGPMTYFGAVPVNMDRVIEVGEHAKLRADELEVKVKITEIDGGELQGEITEIGPGPRVEANGLTRGDVVSFLEQNIVTLYRN